MADEDDTYGQGPNAGAERSGDQQPGAASGQGQAPNQQSGDDGQAGGSQDDRDLTPEERRQLRSESAKYRTRARDLAAERDAALAELSTLKDREKTDQQRMSEELEALRKEKAGWEHARMAAAVAKDKEIPLEWADRLRGTTREELEEDADRLQSMIGSGANGSSRGERYTDFDAGVRGGSPANADMNQLIRRSAGRG